MTKRVLEWALLCVRAIMSIGSARFEVAPVARCASSTRWKRAFTIVSAVSNTHLGERMAGNEPRRTLLAAVIACALTLVSMELSAQTPADAPPVRGAQSASRAGVILYYNLSAAELRLTQRQKAQIDEIADAYVSAVKQVPPIPQGGQLTPDAIQAQRAPRQNLLAALSRVLDAEQRQTFEMLQQRRARPHVVNDGNVGAGPRGGAAR